MIPEVRSSIYRSIAWRLLPFLLLCYVSAQLTRFNISFAKQQFSADLGINDAAFGIAASAFYVGYILFQLPAGLFASRFGVRTAMICMMVAWGTAGSLTAFARSGSDIQLLRFLLGAAQAGFFPVMIFYLSCWFPDRLRGRINTLFTSALPLGSIVAGPLSGLIMGGMDDFQSLRGWQWLFLIEGLSVVVLGIMAYLLLADGPESATWLNASQRKALSADAQPAGLKKPSSFSGLIRGILSDRAVWLLGGIYFGYFCALNALILWGPTLLSEAGVESISAVGWISGLSASLATAGMLLIGRSSDLRKERRWHIAMSGFAAAGSFAILPLASGSIAATAGLLTIAGTGLYAIVGLFWTIPAAHLKSANRASGLAFINMCGVCGGIVSPALVGWLRVMTGSLYSGIGLVAFLLALSMAALLALGPSRTGRLEPKGATATASQR